MILRTPSVVFTRRMIRVNLMVCLLLATLLAVLATPQSVIGQGESSPLIAPVIKHTWTRIGPSSDRACDASAITVMPDGTDGFYMASAGCRGVYHLLDGGSNWSNRSNGLNASIITSIAVAPSQADRLYAGGEQAVFRSDNGGSSWQRLSSYPNDSNTEGVTAIAIHPTNADIVYVLDYNFWAFGRYTQLHSSSDGGESWAQVTLSNTADIAYAVDDSLRMYAVNNDEFLSSDDDWATWTAVTVAPQERHRIEQLHVASSEVFYVTMGSGGGVYRSTDGGASWAAINAGLTDTFITALISDPVDPLTLYAAADGGDIYRYDDDAGHWTAVMDQEDAPFSAVTQLAIDNADPPALLAATPDGLFRSQDGAQWDLLNEYMWNRHLTVTDLVVTGRIDDEVGGSLWVAAGLDGVFSHSTTKEDGIVYPWATSPDAFTGQDVLTIAPDPQNPFTVYAGTTTNLFKRAAAWSTWTESDQGLEPPPLPIPRDVTAESTGLAIIALAVDPTDSNRVYAGTSQSLFISTDGGQNWTANTDFAELANWPIHPAITQIAIAPSDPATIYTRVRIGNKDAQVFKSVDRGESWTIPSVDGRALPAPTHLAVDPLDADLVYGASEWYADGGVWKSVDGGHIWQFIGPNPSIGFTGTHIAIAGSADAIIAAAGVQWDSAESKSYPVVYLSPDDGETWLPISDGLDDVTITALAFDPDRPTNLYAGTVARGVMMANLGQQKSFLPVVFSTENSR